MLIGNLKTSGMRVEVVKDCDLEESKEKFERIISRHVYSSQKTFLDIELLATAGKGDSKYGRWVLLRMRWGKAIAGHVASADKKAIESIRSKATPVLKEAPKKVEENDKIGTKSNNGSENKTKNKSEDKPGKKISPTKPRSNDKEDRKLIQSTTAGWLPERLLIKRKIKLSPHPAMVQATLRKKNLRKRQSLQPIVLLSKIKTRKT